MSTNLDKAISEFGGNLEILISQFVFINEYKLKVFLSLSMFLGLSHFKAAEI